MKTLKAIFFGIRKKEYVEEIQAITRVRKGILNSNDQKEIYDRSQSCIIARLLAAPISFAVSYYIPFPPDFFSPLFLRLSTFIICYRFGTVPLILSKDEFSKEIAIKYNLLTRPGQLRPPRFFITQIDYQIDQKFRKDEKIETFSEYKQRLKETEQRLRETYEHDKKYKRTKNESFEEYRERKLLDEQIKDSNKRR